ncbi:Tubulin/FtsZ, GTPase domain-containing protein [Polychytrium aggregatum]|uniref:Tubulin/FtsZ, GTPase domain-containing protein n=1 Tax=Polychytrium aggregatum TaxID=110093 RepID=UPI0022FE00D7|nr:Tubulin/FtsZ, GTPase domain-containing protein [Polychytrium aggregatum]KAI9207169.1 Tubulin/FtsZ, GTPase domain-containing protein [Polychytrium aggregatum]
MIVLQIGQCGIQVGQSLFKSIESELPGNSLCYPLSKFQQIIVDTERKTWQRHLRENSETLFPTLYVDGGSSGRGNNWAFGYADLEGHVENVLESYRRSVEAQSSYDGCMLIHSIAGGTGSGFGSRLVERLRDDYLKGYIFNSAVVPFASGETALQHYNSLLSLSWMQRHSDFIGLFPNDMMMSSIQRQFTHYVNRGSAKTDKVSLDDLNGYLAHCLSTMLLPLHAAEYKDGQIAMQLKDPTPFDGWDLIQRMTPLPTCKLVSFASSYLSRHIENSNRSHVHVFTDWDEITSRTIRNLGISPPGVKRNCLSSRIYIRGAQGPDYWRRASHFTSKIQSKLGAAIDPAFCDTLVAPFHALDPKSAKKSISLCFNSTETLPYLVSLAEKCERTMKAGAYMHWYEKYVGAGHAGDAVAETQCLFDDALESLRTVISGYQDFV